MPIGLLPFAPDPSPDPPGGDIWSTIGNAWDSISQGVGGAISFAADPLGAIFKATREGAQGLAKDLLPALAHAAEPDLTLDWFLKAYAISFALAIVVWGFLLIFQFIAVSRGILAGQEFLEVLTTRTAVFFGGVIFGPMIGIMLVAALGALTDSLIGWGIGSASDRMLDAMTKMLDVNAAAIPGGVIVGILLMICMIIGLILVLIMLAVMLVTLYFSGVMLPLGLVWITSAKHDSFGRKIPLLWFGIMACHPLLFFLLGVAYNMIAASAAWMNWSDGLRTLMTIVSAVIAMAVAGLAPLLLLKFAPVIPSGAGGQQGASVSVPDGKSYGPQSLSEVREQNRSADAGGGSSDAGSSPAQGSAADPENGSLMTKLRELKGGGGSADAASDTGVSAESGTGTGGGAGKPAVGGPKPGVGAGASAEAGGAAGGAEGMAAAGTAESATGAGAAIGIPTLLAAGAMMAADKAKDVAISTAQAAESGAGYAADGMTDETER